MKFKSFIVGIFCLVSITSCDVVKQIGNSLLIPSNLEMAMGLREALQQGLFTSFDAYSNPENNPALSFVFPNDAQKVVSLINKVGLGNMIKPTTDKFNKALASSFTAAKPIFLNAVKSMNFTDVVNVLITDNDHAATDYFKTTTHTALMNAFRPIVDSTIKMEGANKEWSKIAGIVNNIPFTNFKVENSLTDFIAARAIEGMYGLVATEEKKVRTNLNFRKSDVVKKVFNYADDELKKRKTTGQ
jgi:Protein of unknown function (DUF4197)